MRTAALGRLLSLASLLAAGPAAAFQSSEAGAIGADMGGAFAVGDGPQVLAAMSPFFPMSLPGPNRGASPAGTSAGSAFLPDSMLQDDSPAPESASNDDKSGSGDDVAASRHLRSKRQQWYANRKQRDLTERVKAYRDGRAYRATVYAVGDGEYAAAKAAYAFFQLRRAALKAGIGIEYLSGFRTNAEQAYLYRKYGSPRAARPGYSNHQQGLSMDIEGVDGYGTRAYRWLKKHAPSYGIRNDVPNEYWHWTYVR